MDRKPTATELNALKVIQRAAENPRLADHTVVREPALSMFDGLRPTQRNEMIAAGEYPAPMRVGKRAKAWLLREVLEWQDARKHARDAERTGGAK